ncbi:MAG: hypothetical protein NC132_04755 [Corallococcus sp.]|nr:hypothetical protein [Corallococcus sp.]
MLIQHSMGAFSFRHYLDDILQLFRTNKTKAVACGVFAILGVALGVTVFCISNYNWWYYNRYDYACKLLYGGFFSVMLAFLLSAAVLSALLCLFSVWRQTKFLCIFAAFLWAFYFGANVGAAFTCVGVWAIVYALVLLATELAVNTLCCFFIWADDACNNNFKQIIGSCKPVIILQFAAAIVKLLLIFVLLRPLTALI